MIFLKISIFLPTLYIDSMIAMLPTFFAYDRQNYSRWLPIYISDMLGLENTAPEVYQEFVKGGFSVNSTGKCFTGVATDQALEQTLNKDSKTSGGLVGISNNDEARTKWFLTSHFRAHLLSVQRELCKSAVGAYSSKHHETNRTAKDENDVQCLVSLINQYTANPFSREATMLVNISTGVHPGPGVAKRIVCAKEEGTHKAIEFIEKRVVTQGISFYAPIPKLKIPSFATSEEAKTKFKTAKKVRPINSQQSFAKLLVIARNRHVDLPNLLCHEVGNIPLSLFDETGSMRKMQKSQLLQIMEKFTDDAEETPPLEMTKKAIVIDGLSFVQTMKGIGTFSDYAKSLLKALLQEGTGYNRIDVVFDVYDENSIKSAERKRRGDQKLCSYRIYHDNIRIPKNWSSFLSNIENKNEPVRYLVKTWSHSLDLIPANVEVSSIPP